MQLNTAIFHIVRENVAFSRPGGVFTNVEFGDFLVNATTNLRGNTSIMAPKHTFSIWTAYDWANGFGINVGARAQSKVFIDNANTLTFDGYGMLNLGARYRRGSVEYAVNVNNLTDTEYFASVLYPLIAWGQILIFALCGSC